MGIALDLRVALRQLRSSIGASVVAVGTLSVAIALATSAIATVYFLLVRPLPYDPQDRLVRLSERYSHGAPVIREPLLSSSTFTAWRQLGSATLDGLAAFSERQYMVSNGGETWRLPALAVTSSLFAVVGLRPVAGRLSFEAAAAGPPNEVVLSAHAAGELFGTPDKAVDRRLSLDGAPAIVIGVIADRVSFPNQEISVWVPFDVPALGSGMAVEVIARRRPDASLQSIGQEGTAIARAVDKRPAGTDSLFGSGGDLTVTATDLAVDAGRTVRRVLVTAAVSVGAVLLLACINVGCLLLTRALNRGHEIGVRMALGASRLRVLRSAAAESIAIAVCAGAVAVPLTFGIVASLPATLPRRGEITVDYHVFAAMVFVLATTCLASTLLPALTAINVPATRFLDGSRGVGFASPVAWRRLSSVVLVAEGMFAAAIVLVALLCTKSFVTLGSVDTGFDERNVFALKIFAPARSPAERNAALLAALVQRFNATPDVITAGGANMMPFGDSTYLSTFEIPAAGGAATTVRALEYEVTHGYCEALGLRLLAGRCFTSADESSQLAEAVVNQQLAHALVGPENVGSVVGRVFAGGLGSSEGTTEVVGVVANVLKDGPLTAAQGELYLTPHHGAPLRREMYVVLRMRSSVHPSLQPMREVVASLDANAALVSFEPLATLLSASIQVQRFSAMATSSCALSALALAIAGVFGLLSETVRRRRREIAIRSALGSGVLRAAWLVGSRGVGSVVLGLVIGLALGALLAAPALNPILFNTDLRDPQVWLAASGLLVAPVGACAIPLARAAGGNPATVLRED